MRVCLLASGSKGNAIYVESAQTRLVVDAGLCARELVARMEGIGVSPEGLDALFVSHEHSDHTRGLGPLARRLGLPVYMHPHTRQALGGLGKIREHREFDAGDQFQLKDLSVQTIPLTHDAVAPVGFVFEGAEGRVGIATDLGMVTRLVSERLKGCRVLVLEFNHDQDLLRDGPYPWPLKQRIGSRHGHLSNGDAAELLSGLCWPGLDAVFLAHLSETNNRPELALQCVNHVLGGQNLCDPALIVGRQERVSECFSTLG